jgi:hypothetical protein
MRVRALHHRARRVCRARAERNSTNTGTADTIDRADTNTGAAHINAADSTYAKP